MRFTFVILALLIPSMALAQKPSATIANGICNVAISGNNNTVSTASLRDCGGMDKEQADKIIRLLNTVLAKKDIAEIKAKLDELIDIAGKPVVENNGNIIQQNSGECNQQVVGGNNNTNNCIPAARHLTVLQESGVESLAAQLPDGCQVRFNSADNGESQNFEKELHDAFNKKKKTPDAGWGISWHPKITLIVRVKTADDTCSPYGLVVAKGLVDLGIASEQPTLDDKLPVKTVEILVGEL